MEKRYQVFVSSTFEDLREERQAVIQALLELDCIPYGMELFPAADDDQWTFIEKAIDDCDYYVAIIGGRYGSIGRDGKSYTQMEYEHALKKGKPVVAFVHENIDLLPSGQTEKTEIGKKALSEFRDLARRKLCKSWKTADQLGSVVSRSMLRLIKSHPAIGWVRGDLLGGESAAQEIARLRRRIEDLEASLAEAATPGLIQSDDLAQGADSTELRFSYGPGTGGFGNGYALVLKTTWDEILVAMGTKLLVAEREELLESALNDLYMEKKGRNSIPVTVSPLDLNRILIQFRALGYITTERSSTNDSRRWILTMQGEAALMRISAQRRF